MRIAKHRKRAPHKSEKQPRLSTREREWNSLDSQISTLEQEAQDLSSNLSRYRAISSALTGDSSPESALNAYVQKLRENYPQDCIARLVSVYDSKVSTLLESESALRLEAVSLFEALLASTNDNAVKKVLLEETPQDALPALSAIELLSLLRKHAANYFEALYSKEAQLQKEDRRLSRAQDFQRRTSQQVKAIITQTNILGRPLREEELEEILAGAPADCLEELPSRHILETITDLPDETVESLNKAKALKERVLEEFSALVCPRASFARATSFIPATSEIEELHQLRDGYSDSEWERVLNLLDPKERMSASASELRGYLAAQKRICDSATTGIPLPSQYLKRFRPGHLLTIGEAHPLISGLQSLYPEFVYRLPGEVRSGIANAHAAVKSALSRHHEFMRLGVDRKLIADIIVLGIFNFGVCDPNYSLQELHERLQKRQVYNGTLKDFLMLFNCKLLTLHQFFFRSTLEAELEPSSRVRFCGCWPGNPNGNDCGLSNLQCVRRVIDEHALSGDELSGRISLWQGCLSCVDALLTSAALSNDYLGKILELAPTDRGDIQAVAKIITRPLAGSHLLSSRIWGLENTLLDLVQTHHNCFQHTNHANTIIPPELLERSWAKESGIAELVEITLSECAQLSALMEESPLAHFYQHIRNGNRLKRFQWQDFLKAFEDTFRGHADDFCLLQEKGEVLMAELRIWRRQFDD